MIYDEVNMHRIFIRCQTFYLKLLILVGREAAEKRQAFIEDEEY